MRFVALIMFALVSASGYADVVRGTVECTAKKALQMGGGASEDFTVNSSLYLSLKTEDGVTILDHIGHVKISNDSSAAATASTVYYGQFFGKKVPVTLSPRARKYTDAEYYRFKDFDALNTSGHDGGGMWGYLVVSKAYYNGNGSQPFAAHYVFKAGDHIGGTVNYSCVRD